jgi:hypothetical protein
VTNQATRTAIVHRANDLGFGVSFQGPTDADRATVRYDNGRGAVAVKGKLDRVLASINAHCAGAGRMEWPDGAPARRWHFRVVKEDTMTTKQIICAKIVAQIAAGKSLRDAIDAVLGAGTFAAVASEVYDELRARVGK